MSASIYFGKGTANPCHSIFRLIGNDEDALTYALGYLLASYPDFCIAFLKKIDFLGPGARRRLFERYSVRLQEVSGGGRGGRRDIVIETCGQPKHRVVIEAKIGGNLPSKDQLLQYIVGNRREDNSQFFEENWGDYQRAALVCLTRDPVDAATLFELTEDLSGRDRKYSRVRLLKGQWHDVFELALSHMRGLQHDPVSWFLFNEFARFFREDYEMRYYDAEVAIRDLDPLNSKIHDQGRVYVCQLRSNSAPLYFAPYFTQSNESAGLYLISRVLYVGQASVRAPSTKELFASQFNRDSELRRHWDSYWHRGLDMVAERAKEEGWDGENRLYFLDAPIRLREIPLKKSKAFPMIPVGFSLTIADILTRDTLDEPARLGAIG